VRTFDLDKIPANEIISEIAPGLKKGGILIAPTETAYGLLTRADDKNSVRNLYQIKKRSLAKPSAIFIKGTVQISDYAELTDTKLIKGIEQLWPGPVTIILKARQKEWPGIVSAEGKIGFRCSSHQFMLKLTAALDFPLTATSANLSGFKADTFDELKNAFGDKVEYCIIDPDLNFDRPLSTVVDLTGSDIKILRQGAVDEKTLRKAFSNVG